MEREQFSVSNLCSIIKKIIIKLLILKTSELKLFLYCYKHIFSVHNHVDKQIDHLYKTAHVGETYLLKCITC